MPTAQQPKIAILLGTHQGEKYLAQQLDSIEAQTHTSWSVWASDDDSRDGTLEILKRYREKWGEERMTIVRGPARGFRANFMSLACKASIAADFYAFCDQDDLWDRGKLDVALSWLASLPLRMPALYCARTRLIDESGAAIGFSPLFPRPPIFENALVQSIAGGNTMVFNAAARALLMEAGADVDVQTHDWWAYLLVTGCGGMVKYDPTPQVGYRQHIHNLVGSNASWSGRSRRFHRILRGDFRSMNDRNLAALARVHHRLSPRNRAVLDQFTLARQSPPMARVAGIRRSGVYCQTRLSNIALWIAAALGKI